MNSKQEQPTISISYPATFYGFLIEQGIDADSIYKKAEIDIAWFNDPEQKITDSQFIALTRQGLAAWPGPSMGLSFGAVLSLQSHDYLGFAIQSAASSKEAIRLMCQYSNTRAAHISLSFHESDEQAYLQIEDRLGAPDLHVYMLETCVSSIYRGYLALHLIDKVQKHGAQYHESIQKGHILELQFEYQEPSHIETYQALFEDEKLTFGCDKTRIILNTKTLARPFSFSNPLALKLAEDQCRAELEALTKTQSITTKTHNILFEEVTQFPSAEALATRLNMSTRALSRKLKEENTSYQEILDNVRKQLSIQYLKTTELSVAEIAYRLNYEHPTNFTRAFKKWTDKSPSDYRPTEE